MTNTILFFVLLGISLFFLIGRPTNRGVLLGMLAVIGGILLFVSATAASAGSFGPAIGVGAFVGTFALFYYLRRRGK
jgi:hypothetical protein